MAVMTTANPTRIAVLVSGGGTNLQALIDTQNTTGLGGGEIALVLASKPGVYALERAARHGIPSVVVARKDYPDIAAYSAALVETYAIFALLVTLLIVFNCPFM